MGFEQQGVDLDDAKGRMLSLERDQRRAELDLLDCNSGHVAPWGLNGRMILESMRGVR